jgi:hypothetical protein
MITGFNTDVEHDGVVYHVQTEDKGLDSPILLSLVYSGGAILASKRSSYGDLIAAGFDEGVLVERLQRQHKLICAAINAGRIDDLKKMSSTAAKPAASVESAAQPVPPEVPLQIEPKPEVLVTQSAAPEFRPVTGPLVTPPPVPSQPSAYTVYDARRHSSDGEESIEQGLRIVVIGDRDFRGGDAVELQLTVVHVSQRGEAPVTAAISVKVLGTTFRPVILSLKTDRQGTVAVNTRIPPFKSGRAAIVIKATAAGLSAETRRVIHPN